MNIYLHDKDIPKTCFGCPYSNNVWGPNKFEMTADCVLINQRVSCTHKVDVKCPLRSIEAHDKELSDKLKESINNTIVNEYTEYGVTGIPSSDTISIDTLMDVLNDIK